MKTPKVIRKHKYLVIFLAVATIAAVGMLVYSPANSYVTSREKYYSCIYGWDEGDYVRCEVIGGPEEYRGGCKGYYTLLGRDIKDGIDVSDDENGFATCENISADTAYIFNINGEYLNKEESK